jgi:hypothetical protein
VTPPSAPPAPRTTLRLIHGALLVAPLFILGALAVLFRGLPPLELLSGALGYVLYAASAAGLAFAVWWRLRIPARASGRPEAEYWRATLPRAVALWAMAEGVALLGGVVAILAGQAPVTMVVIVIYVGLMVTFAPNRLAGT